VTTLFFDTSYLFRIYSGEHGHEYVKKLLPGTREIVSSVHARAEFAATLLRHRREGRGLEQTLKNIRDQYKLDCSSGGLRFLALDERVIERAEAVLEDAPSNIFIRGADALHLACAAENGFAEIYSNDRHLLAAAPLFNLRGVNVIPA
jgi:predicted nucleic acid-binding protein